MRPTSMLSRFRTAIWHAGKPENYAHLRELLVRRLFRQDHDTQAHVERATRWSAERSESVRDALARLDLLDLDESVPSLPAALMTEGEMRAQGSPVRMGGPGDLDLIYAAVSLSRAKRVIETGVAYGWSSLAILAALEQRPDSRLISVDMPYPNLGNEDFVGLVVPEKLRGKWDLIREPDRRGLEKAIAQFKGIIDLCHYDSDKEWWGRIYAYPLLWTALAPGGVFISDDIQDNLAFADFVTERDLRYAVVESGSKFVGIARKSHQPLGGITQNPWTRGRRA
jgi:predicted O-methyltransferase YrrM